MRRYRPHVKFLGEKKWGAPVATQIVNSPADVGLFTKTWNSPTYVSTLWDWFDVKPYKPS